MGNINTIGSEIRTPPSPLVVVIVGLELCARQSPTIHAAIADLTINMLPGVGVFEMNSFKLPVNHSGQGLSSNP